jgi:hypothetical protein
MMSEYQCTCPPTEDEEEEIKMALDCWEREQEWNQEHGRPSTADGSSGHGEGE